MVDGPCTPRRGGSYSVAAVVLAAGCSRRMGGDNKLLLEFGRKPILVHVVEAVSACGVDEVIVVTGHEADRVRDVLAVCNVRFVHNRRFADGLSTSLGAGIGAVSDGAGGALVCLGDMPLITVPLLARLTEAFGSWHGQRICVPTHQGRRGNPVLWPRALFQEILHLNGDRGARELLLRRPELVHQVEVQSTGIFVDIDTREDLYRIVQQDDAPKRV